MISSCYAKFFTTAARLTFLSTLGCYACGSSLPTEPKEWQTAAAIEGGENTIGLGATREQVRASLGEPVIYNAKLDVDATVDSVAPTKYATKTIETFYVNGRWYRVSMRRKSLRRPTARHPGGLENMPSFEVIRLEVRGEMNRPALQTLRLGVAGEPTLDSRPAIGELRPPVRRFRTPGVEVSELSTESGRVFIGQRMLAAATVLPRPEVEDAEDDPGITITSPSGPIIGMTYVNRYRLGDGQAVVIRFRRDVPHRPFTGRVGAVHHAFVVHRITSN